MGFKFLSRSSMRGEKATLGTSLGASLTPTLILRIVLRFFQFVMGLTVIGLYAVDLDNARKQGKYVDSKWVWAVVCGTLGSIISLAFMAPFAKAWSFAVHLAPSALWLSYCSSPGFSSASTRSSFCVILWPLASSARCSLARTQRVTRASPGWRTLFGCCWLTCCSGWFRRSWEVSCSGRRGRQGLHTLGVLTSTSKSLLPAP